MSEQISKLTQVKIFRLFPDAVGGCGDERCKRHRLHAVRQIAGRRSNGAVVEWNRDNVFEHPVLRNLPDGDLSELVLGYQEQRTDCTPLDSNL